MKPLKVWLVAVVLLQALVIAVTCCADDAVGPPEVVAWSECCGAMPWPATRQWPAAMSAPDPATFARYRPRQALVRMSGVPAPYDGLRNPLPRTPETVARGQAAYDGFCAACHGVEGNGVGVRGGDLFPAPGQLRWVGDLPRAAREGYLFWTIKEGGAPLGTDMTAFAGTLSDDDIWAVVAYVLARLPQPAGGG